MEMNEKDILQIANLLQLNLTSQEREIFSRQLPNIIDYMMAKINELDITNVAPLIHPAEISNVTRDDVIESIENIDKKSLLKNAEDKGSGLFFNVPKIIG